MLDSNLVFHVLIAFGAFQALFMASIILLQGPKHLAKHLFAGFLLIEGVTLVERLLADTGLIESVPHLLGVSYPLSFIKAPLLFLSALAIIDPKFRLRKIHALHLIPFALILLLNIPFYFLAAAEKLAIVAAFLNKVPVYFSFDFFLSLSFFGHIGAYLAATLVRLYGYQRQVKNNHLANWYLKVLLLYTLTLAINLAYFLILPSGWLELPLFHTVSMLVLTFLIQSIAYSFMTRASIFSQAKGPNLDKLEQWRIDEQIILEQFEKEKIHLNDTLTLAHFAKAVQLSPKYVSDLINQRLGCSFKELLSKYRMQEARAIMERQVAAPIPLIEIAFASGFSNKVSFYRTFKKHTGQAPSAYFKDLQMNKNTKMAREPKK